MNAASLRDTVRRANEPYTDELMSIDTEDTVVAAAAALEQFENMVHVQALDARGIVRQRWIVRGTDSVAAINTIRNLDPDEPLPAAWSLIAATVEWSDMVACVL